MQYFLTCFLFPAHAQPPKCRLPPTLAPAALHTDGPTARAAAARERPWWGPGHGRGWGRGSGPGRGAEPRPATPPPRAPPAPRQVRCGAECGLPPTHTTAQESRTPTPGPSQQAADQSDRPTDQLITPQVPNIPTNKYSLLLVLIFLPENSGQSNSKLPRIPVLT